MSPDRDDDSRRRPDDSFEEEPSLSGGETRFGGSSSVGGKSVPVQVGEMLGGRYELVERIGQGGMGVVFRARDRHLGREVAIKFLLAHWAAGSEGLDRFRREARSIADLNDVNIVSVHDFDEDHHGPFLVMEYVAGTTLSQYVASRGALDEDEAVRIFIGVCRGAEHAHRRGIIHRDIKPANVMLDREGTPKLMDFGLARGEAAAELSLTGYGMGTLDYAAPEQKRDAKSVDLRADVYSLGATFYELLTGLKPVPLHLSKVPERWRGVIEKACEPLPEDRHYGVDGLLAEVEDIAAGAVRASGTRVGDDLGCPTCGTDNALDARFCRGCGEKLQSPCPACGEQARIGLRHCDRCGANIQGALEIAAVKQRVLNLKAEGNHAAALNELASLDEIVARGFRLGGLEDIDIWRGRELGEINRLAGIGAAAPPPRPPPRRPHHAAAQQVAAIPEPAHVDDEARHQEIRQINSQADGAVTAGIVGVIMCFPAPIGWFLGRSVVKRCRRIGHPVPARARVGLWMGFFVTWIYAAIFTVAILMILEEEGFNF